VPLRGGDDLTVSPYRSKKRINSAQQNQGRDPERVARVEPELRARF
jgi:hypothetical protein